MVHHSRDTREGPRHKTSSFLARFNILSVQRSTKSSLFGPRILRKLLHPFLSYIARWMYVLIELPQLRVTTCLGPFLRVDLRWPFSINPSVPLPTSKIVSRIFLSVLSYHEFSANIITKNRRSLISIALGGQTVLRFDELLASRTPRIIPRFDGHVGAIVFGFQRKRESSMLNTQYLRVWLDNTLDYVLPKRVKFRRSILT